MSLKYRHSSKTKAAWEALNPVIVADEIVIEKDTRLLKIGDGIKSYNDLSYATQAANLNGTNYLMVYGIGTLIENAAELQAAYNEAKNMPRFLGFLNPTTPKYMYAGQTFGRYLEGILKCYKILVDGTYNPLQMSESLIVTPEEAKSVRTTVIVAPGNYDFGVTAFVHDASGINIVSLTGNVDVLLNGISVTADYSLVKGIDTQTERFIVGSNLDNTIFENCIGLGNNSFGNDDELTSVISSTFINCVGGQSSFGAGENTQITGKFINCTGGLYSFLGSGFNGTLSGKFTNCIGGANSFGGDEGSSLSGTFTNCTGGVNSFGGWVDLPSGVSGTLINCTLTDGVFPLSASTGKIYNCIDGNGNLVNSYSTYADEAAAVTAGLSSGTTYKTATGELRIKL